jgi:hypothetical protein
MLNSNKDIIIRVTFLLICEDDDEFEEGFLLSSKVNAVNNFLSILYSVNPKAMATEEKLKSYYQKFFK